MANTPNDEELDVLADDAVEKSLKQFLSLYGAPAFMRRAQQVRDAQDRLLRRCHAKRKEWLQIVRVRVGMLYALAGGARQLDALLAQHDLDTLAALQDSLKPKDYAWVKPTRSDRSLRKAVKELFDSIDLFNRRWAKLIDEIDLSEINELRDKYNRYYLLEKECLVRSPRVARQGFTPLPPMTRDDLLASMPLLPTISLPNSDKG